MQIYRGPEKGKAKPRVLQELQEVTKEFLNCQKHNL